jgi:hypothetical protein
MKVIAGRGQVLSIILVFILSRLIAQSVGLHLNLQALVSYWQYLDLDTLRNHLLAGIWYDHAQPPVFNLLLGCVLKIGGSHYPVIFSIIFKFISLANALLLFAIVKKISTICFLPVVVAMVYILSPATLIFECELFYTTFISFLLLISVLNLIGFTENNSWRNVLGFMCPLMLICLTRSVYHMLWLFAVIVLILSYFRKKEVFHKLVVVSLVAVIVTGSWYLKNKIIFGKLTASTWIGMNMARNVFHDSEVKDSSRIEAYEPFSRVGVYRKFLDPEFEKPFVGLNDRDLLQEMKNDSFINETEVSYIPVSDMYERASVLYIRNHPAAYMKNVFQSSVLYFTPATLYSLAVEQADKIKYYDILYSFNLTHFANGKQERRILLTISAIPKMMLYFFVISMMIRYSYRSRSFTPWNLFILMTIGWVFGISSLFEHYENMRFRFESEPLFLILAAQVFSRIYSRFRISFR